MKTKPKTKTSAPFFFCYALLCCAHQLVLCQWNDGGRVINVCFDVQELQSDADPSCSQPSVPDCFVIEVQRCLWDFNSHPLFFEVYFAFALQFKIVLYFVPLVQFSVCLVFSFSWQCCLRRYVAGKHQTLATVSKVSSFYYLWIFISTYISAFCISVYMHLKFEQCSSHLNTGLWNYLARFVHAQSQHVRRSGLCFWITHTPSCVWVCDQFMQRWPWCWSWRGRCCTNSARVQSCGRGYGQQVGASVNLFFSVIFEVLSMHLIHFCSIATRFGTTTAEVLYLNADVSMLFHVEYFLFILRSWLSHFRSKAILHVWRWAKTSAF